MSYLEFWLYIFQSRENEMYSSKRPTFLLFPHYLPKHHEWIDGIIDCYPSGIGGIRRWISILINTQIIIGIHNMELGRLPIERNMQKWSYVPT
jgi:hypothetical protein